MTAVVVNEPSGADSNGALNQISGPKEAIPLVESDHNNHTPQKQAAWFQRSEEVLGTLLVGRPFHPDDTFTRPGG